MKNLLAMLAVLLSSSTRVHADWPGFRGPGGLGISSQRGLPIVWSVSKNVVWKTRLPGPGTSSPITWNDHIFLTCYSGYGLAKEPAGDLANLKRHLLCFDRTSGKLLWNQEVPAQLPEVKYESFITEHGYASSTPVTDGERVYVFFGRSGVLAFDFQGKQLWRTEVGKYLNAWGSAASPILFRNLVIVNATVESTALVALDKATGTQVWRVPKLGDCWSTPALVDLADGTQELILSTQEKLLGFNPVTGARLWECEGPGSGAASSSPIARHGIIYSMGAGTDGAAIMALKAGGRGDVTKTHILWKQKKAGANHTSPVLVGERLYWLSGQFWCIRADTGAIVFRERLYQSRGEYVSAVAGDGKIFAFTRRDGAFVLAAKDTFEQLAHNDLGDDSIFNASPAISHGHLLVRSNAFLYCLGEPDPGK